MKRSWMHAFFTAGIVATVVGAAVAYTEVIGPARYGSGNLSPIGWWVALVVLLIGTSYGLGLPEMPRSRFEAFARSLAAVGISLAALSMPQLALAQSLLPRSSVLIVSMVTPLWTVLVWNLVSDLQSWSTQRERLMVITDRPDDVAALRADLEGREEIPAQLVAVLTIDEARMAPDGRMPLLERVEESEPTVMVLDRSAQADDTIVAQVSQIHRTGVRVRTLALFYEGWLGKLPLAELAQVSLLFDIGELHRAHYIRAKRVLDLAIGLMGLVALAVVAPVVAAVNLVGNKGPLFFNQVRVGKDGVPFTMYKFRTMTASQGDNTTWTSESDLRITPFGHLMRKLHLDELPQMVNILRGQLSIVGPRPEQVAYVEELRTKIPFYDERHIVRPGLTGWAQVKLGYTATDQDALEKLQYDFYYLRRQSIMFDLRIVGRTIREVVGGLGR